MVMRTLKLALIAILGSWCFATSAFAIACGSDVQVTSGAVAGTFDPFAPTQQSFASVSLTFTRAVNSSGGGKTQDMAFYMQQPAGSPSGDQVIWPDTSQNILFTAGGSHPTLNSPPTAVQPTGVAVLSWGGASKPDTITKTVSITLDPGFDPVAQPTINFDMVYVCKGTGGYTDVTTPTTLPGVIQISIQVLSGLQASYAGPALAFGEIGQVTNAQASAHTASGQFQIKSSGAFTVDLTSGNHFLMTYPLSGQTTPGLGTVKYQLDFLGQTLSNGTETFTQTSCHRAGVSAFAFIPISVQLLEGGQGKTPSNNYSDTLSVTFTPVADPGTSQPSCTL